MRKREKRAERVRVRGKRRKRRREEEKRGCRRRRKGRLE